MSTNKIRAKIRHRNKDIHLGYYATQAQAAAAKVGAHAALDKWEALNPPKPVAKKKMPNVKTLIHFIHQGTYDSVIEEIAEASTARWHLIKRHNYMRGRFPTPTGSSASSKAIFDFEKLNRTKTKLEQTRR